MTVYRAGTIKRKRRTKAYEGKAWKALGYKTWEAYVQTEFDMSRRHSYRLLDQGRVIREIAEATGQDVTRVSQINVTHGRQIPERVIREIKDDLPEIKEQIRERVERGEDPKKAVDETVAAKAAEQTERAHIERIAELMQGEP